MVPRMPLWTGILARSGGLPCQLPWWWSSVPAARGRQSAGRAALHLPNGSCGSRASPLLSMRGVSLLVALCATVQTSLCFQRTLHALSTPPTFRRAVAPLSLMEVSGNDDSEERKDKFIQYLSDASSPKEEGSEAEAGSDEPRPFETLVDYPCEFAIKVIGLREGDFHTDMIRRVASVTGAEAGTIRFSVLDKGKYQSVTIHAPVQNADMLYACYEEVSKDERVKFKF